VRLNGRELLFGEARQLRSFELSLTFSRRWLAVVTEKSGEGIDSIPEMEWTSATAKTSAKGLLAKYRDSTH
jgi:hypothetical protein